MCVYISLYICTRALFEYSSARACAGMSLEGRPCSYSHQTREAKCVLRRARNYRRVNNEYIEGGKQRQTVISFVHASGKEKESGMGRCSWAAGGARDGSVVLVSPVRAVSIYMPLVLEDKVQYVCVCVCVRDFLRISYLETNVCVSVVLFFRLIRG